MEGESALREHELDFVAAVLSDSDLFRQVVDITPERLVTPVAHGLWEIIYRYGGTIGAATLFEQLRASHHADQLLEEFPTLPDLRHLWTRGQSANGRAEAEFLRQEAVKREIDDILFQRRTDLPPDRAALDLAERLTNAAARVAPPSTQTELMDALDASMELYRWKQSNPTLIPGWRTGERQYDEILKENGGFDKKGRLVVVGATTGVGKTHWLTDKAARFLTTPRDDTGALPKVAFFSMEMPTEDVLGRLIARLAQVDLTAPATPQSEAKLVAAHKQLEEMISMERLAIFHRINTIDQIDRKIRNMRAQDKLDIAIIDYIGMIQNPTRYAGNSYREIGDIVKMLQATALDTAIPIITAQQLNRDTYRNDGQRPGVHNIAESMVVSQCADFIHLLWRPDQGAKGLVGRNLGLWKDVAVVLNEKTRAGKRPRPSYYHIDGSTSTFSPIGQDMVAELESEEQQSLLQQMTARASS